MLFRPSFSKQPEAMSTPPYEDIPTAGGDHRGSKKRGGEEEYEQHSNVRAQDPPDLPGKKAQEKMDGDSSSHTFQTMKSDTMGTYRVRRWKPGQTVGAAAEGYEETGRPGTNEDLDADIRQETTDRRYAVLENTESGEVFVDQQENLSDNWFAGGQFDQITFFADQDEAAAYADERQGAS